MIESAHSARDDLAFMRAVAEDRGPLPVLLGAHMLAVGLIFGVNVIYIWAGMAGLAPLPQEWLSWSWAPGAIVYAPVIIWLSIWGMRISWGPAARAFAAAWSAVAVMTFTIVAIVILASARTGEPYYEVWPAIALALYAGAWMVVAIALRRTWSALLALGCCATAVTCGWLVRTPEYWLAMGLGLLLFLALPGALMMRRSKPA